MPLSLTVLVWVATVSLTLITLVVVAFIVAAIVAALEVRALVRAIGHEVRWIRQQRRYITYRTRFAGKWLRIMGQKIARQL